MLLGFFFLLILRLPVIILGHILKPDHSPISRGDIVFIKMQGGGSLVIAFQAILSIKKRYEKHKIILLTTQSVAQFGESLNVFDEIICINDKSLPLMFLSTLSAWWRCFRVDTVVDLEVYSRLTTVFSALTAARNRIGFYLESVFWRKGMHTHLIFFNRFAGVYHFYEQVAKLLDAPLVPVEECTAMVAKRLVSISKPEGVKRISIGHSCSEMGTERMLTADQWLTVFLNRNVTNEEFVFLGAKSDRGPAQLIIEKIMSRFPAASFKNMCGTLSLMESISYLHSSDEFWGIDSALLHYARLMGKKTVSYWGPTDPMTRLKKFPYAASETYYRKVPCSPCIHVAEEPPCSGDNICIQSIFAEDIPAEADERLMISKQ